MSGPVNVMDRDLSPAPEAEPPKRGPGRPPGAKNRRPAPAVTATAAPPPSPTPAVYVPPTPSELQKVRREGCAILAAGLMGATAITGDYRWAELTKLPQPGASVVDGFVQSTLDLCVAYELPLDGKVTAWVGLFGSVVMAGVLFRSLPAPPPPNGAAPGHKPAMEGAAPAAQ